MSGDAGYFDFSSESGSTVLDDCLSLIRQSAAAGCFVAGGDSYSIDLECPDECMLEGYEDE